MSTSVQPPCVVARERFEFDSGTRKTLYGRTAIWLRILQKKAAGLVGQSTAPIRQRHRLCNLPLAAAGERPVWLRVGAMGGLRARWLAAAVAIACSATLSHARCVLPVPDGGEQVPSMANLHGTIVAINDDVVSIQPPLAARPVRVRVALNTPIYTAFGGDVEASDLRVGQVAWVWFERCRRPVRKTPRAAYFQIFSKDRSDRP